MCDERIGDVARHPFLIGEAVADGIDHAGDAAEAVQATSGNVGDVRDATEGNEVMRADAMNGNAADYDHVAACVGKPSPSALAGSSS